MIVASLILLSLGIVLWYFSRFGPTVSHHPFCRACGFDLFMLPLETRRCPECGADILAEHAIRLGHRKPVRSGQIAAAFVTIAGIGLLTISLLAWWSGFDGSHYKSAAQLRHDLALPEARLRTRAFVELRQRLRAHTLAPADTDQLAQTILALQIDPALAWDAWGDLVQQAHVTPGTSLSPSLWGKFVEQAMQISAKTRPRVRTGDPIPIGITCKLKAGTDWLASAIAFTAAVETTLAPLTERFQGRTQTATSQVPLEWTLLWQPPQTLAPGAQTLHLDVTLTAREGTHLMPRTVRFDLSIECLEAAHSSVTLYTPPTPQARQDFEEALQWRLRTHEDGSLSLTARSLGNLWVADPPITAAFRVVLRQSGDLGAGTGEWLLARFMVQPGDAALVPLSLPASGPHPGPAEIVCIAEPTLPTATTNVLEIWGPELHHRITLAP